jgi:hypothetical protein
MVFSCGEAERLRGSKDESGRTERRMIEPSMKVGRARARVERIERNGRTAEEEQYLCAGKRRGGRSGALPDRAGEKPGPGKRREQTPLLRLQIGDMKKRKGRRLLTFDRSL